MIKKVLTLAVWLVRMDLKERSSIIWIFIMPAVFIGFFGVIFGGAAESDKAGLGIVDQDATFLSRTFVEMLGESDGLQLRAIEQGDSSGVSPTLRRLYIAKGFTDSLASGRRAPIRYETRKGGDRTRDFSADIQIKLAVARMLGLLVECDTTAGGARRYIDPESPAFQARIEVLRARPERIEVQVRTAGKGRALPSGFGATAPAMLVLFMLMNAATSGAVILTQEKQSRCLARLACMPVTRTALLAGKVIGLLFLALIQSCVILVLGRLVFGVSWGSSPLALAALLLCLAVAASALGVLLGALLRTPEQAGAVSWIVPLLLGAFGGCWWPLEIAPTWMQAVGHISPAAWAMDGMHGLLAFGFGPSAVLVPCMALIAYGVVLIAVGSRLLRVD